MPNAKQNNETEHISKETSLLQDRIKINEKSLNQFQNGLMRIWRIRAKQRQRTNLSQKILKNILQNKIKHIEKKANPLRNTLAHVKTRKRLFEKGLKKIAKMQNFSQNEFNQIAEMHGQSQDELEQIAKLRRIKNYEEMTS